MSVSSHAVSVIAIDGPSASGKGAVAYAVAAELGFHYLDSGALYRLVALAAMQKQIDLSVEKPLAELATNLDVSFKDGEIWLNGKVVSKEIRSEHVAKGASQVATLGEVRAALLQRQRDFRREPGLVAEGRDMGSVVFRDAILKVFLTASAEARAERRYKQLIEKGMCANLSDILRDIQQRDVQDSSRRVAPLQKCEDAKLLDTTALTIGEAVAQIIAWYHQAIQQV